MARLIDLLGCDSRYDNCKGSGQLDKSVAAGSLMNRLVKKTKWDKGIIMNAINTSNKHERYQKLFKRAKYCCTSPQPRDAGERGHGGRPPCSLLLGGARGARVSYSLKFP